MAAGPPPPGGTGGSAAGRRRRVRIISGGQTGIDKIALDCARAAGLPTGGTAPKGYKTEHGPNPDLASYGLKEHASRDYIPRTEQNVKDGDVTVIFTDDLSETAHALATRKRGGSARTYQFCAKHRKPCLVNPSLGALLSVLRRPDIHVANFAGPRGSRLPVSVADWHTASLCMVFGQLVLQI